MLWTRANNLHWTSTLDLVRNVNRFICFLDTNISKHRLNNAQASGIDLFALWTIYFSLHFVDRVGLVLIHPDREIPARCVWFAQAPRSQGAGGTIFWTGMVYIIQAIAVALVAGIAGQFLSLWAEVDLFGGVERETFCGKGPYGITLSLPGMKAGIARQTAAWGVHFEFLIALRYPSLRLKQYRRRGTAWVLGWLAHYPFVSVKMPTTIQVGRL